MIVLILFAVLESVVVCIKEVVAFKVGYELLTDNLLKKFS
jgi:hypothetical protein